MSETPDPFGPIEVGDADPVGPFEPDSICGERLSTGTNPWEALVQAFMTTPCITRPIWAFGGGWHAPQRHEAERMADVALAAIRGENR